MGVRERNYTLTENYSTEKINAELVGVVNKLIQV